jgi:chromate transporter
MTDPTPPPPPGLWALFSGFCSASALGFGGVLPWTRRMVVEERRWQTAAEFTDLLALCQFLPGPNVINYSVCLGSRFRGLPGAVAAFTGVLAVPMGTVLALGVLYGRYGDHPLVAHAFRGLAAAASGLVLATAWKIAAPLRGRPRGIVVAVAAFGAIAVLRLPLLPVLAALVPASIVVQRGGR